MSLLDVLATVLALVPSVLLMIFTIEVCSGLWPLAAAPVGEGAVPATVVLIPAHNEAAGIAATVASIRAGSSTAIDVLVVADNCSDETAAIARASGARVAERNDPSRRGKGFALAFGRDLLATDPPACLVVLDADCVIEGAGLAFLAREAIGKGRVVQARNLQRPDPSATPIEQISGFAFLLKNLVRQRGMTRLAGVAALTGTGMAFPWATFAIAPLASAELAEDLSLGVWLVQRREAPQFVEATHIWSDPAKGGDLIIQRTRWERGFLSTARRWALPLVMSGIAWGSRSRCWFGLHLLVPPLAVLFAAGGTSLAMTILLCLFGASLIPSLFLAIALSAASLATVFAWHRAGRAYVSGTALLGAPKYVAAKLPVYRAMFSSSEGWIRTRRPGEGVRKINAPDEPRS